MIHELELLRWTAIPSMTEGTVRREASGSRTPYYRHPVKSILKLFSRFGTWCLSVGPISIPTNFFLNEFSIRKGEAVRALLIASSSTAYWDRDGPHSCPDYRLVEQLFD